MEHEADQTPDMMGRDAGEVGSSVDHTMAAPQASVEGMPYGEERLESDTRGRVDVEHGLTTAPAIPHEVLEKLKDSERDAD